ncbi:hypothetical protein L218DRAFT_1081798 [Marasmius fiardii PR-910]|nr:hypothetical protein L218DRAFT_1081798 [Marasmius fiardii PR-910]
MSNHTHELDPNHKFPPELVDKFMTYLRNDKATLLSLCLVCRSWLPLARSFLFDKLSIESPPNNLRCDKVLDCTGILGFIRHVVIMLVYILHVGGETEEVEYLSSVVKWMEQADIALKRLTITCLHRDFNLYRHLFESLSASSPFSNIVQLNVMFHEDLGQDVLPFICSFPRLRILCAHFDTIRVGRSEASFDRLTCTLPVSLEKLLLRLLPPFTKAGCIKNLLKLQPYASLCSKYLRFLTLDIRDVPAQLQELDLSSFEILESLEVGPRIVFQSDCSVLCRALETISSPRFCKLGLIGLCIVSPYSDPSGLKALDEILTTERFSSVTVEAHIERRCACLPLWFERSFEKGEVEGLLEGCAEQGRLKVTIAIEHSKGLAY